MPMVFDLDIGALKTFSIHHYRAYMGGTLEVVIMDKCYGKRLSCEKLAKLLTMS